jgi:hypothetical protein
MLLYEIELERKPLTPANLCKFWALPRVQTAIAQRLHVGAPATLGARIARARVMCGLDQKQLGALLTTANKPKGYTGEAVSKWENDVNQPIPAVRAILERVLGLRKGELT